MACSCSFCTTNCCCANTQIVRVLGPTPVPEPPAASAIIPFASGTTPVVLTRTDVATVVVNTGAMVGFGNSAPVAGLSTGIITLSAALGDFAFVVPRAGTVTSISAFFSATVVTALVAAGTVRAELWIAPAASNTFTPTGVAVNLVPDFSPASVVGAPAAGTAAAAFSVAAGDKLLMVFSLNPTTTPPGPTNIGALTGFASAGVAIS